jgi:hypothetical protein
MLLFITTLGGLLLMMGHHSRAESLFHYFRLEDQVPENHLLRLIDRHVNFELVRAKLKDAYSDTGRPSIDPELPHQCQSNNATPGTLRTPIRLARSCESASCRLAPLYYSL